MIIELYAKSDVGRVRRGNEDNFLLLDLTTVKTWTGTDGPISPDEMRRIEIGEKGVILVVSDGMGGALAGDVASSMAVQLVRELLIDSESTDGSICIGDQPLAECLRNATVYANMAIHRKSQEDSRCSGMGATFTGAAIRAGALDIIQVGDSRGYVLRKDQIKLATKDQSLVQQLVDVGQISEEEAETHMYRNVILQALGAQEELAPISCRLRIRRGDLLLLCSDGLSGKLRADDMRQIVSDSNGDLSAACDALVEEANRRGGEDNITVVLARFIGDDLAEADDDKITIELPVIDEDSTLGDLELPTETPN
jgi:protein phosphatase